MNAEELKGRIIDIAVMDMADRRPALDKLQAECAAADYRQTIKDLNAMLNLVLKSTPAGIANPLVDKINEDWFLVVGEGAVRFARWEEAGLHFYNRAGFAMAVATLTGLAQGQPPESVYLCSSNRREYRGITIDAKGDEVIDGKVNLWRGYGVKRQLWDEAPFLKYLRTVYPNEWKYIRDWCAWTIQNPDRRTNVALFLISSTQGTGKSTLGNIMRKLFGRHAVKVSRSKDLTGDFTAHLSSALFVHGDEILFKGNRAGADSLKTMITDDTLRLEAKGVPSFEADNRLSLLLTSNHEHAAHISAGDRRYAFAEASDKLAGNKDYWTEFYAWLEGDGYEGILAYLLDVDVSDFNPVADRPFSELALINKRGSLKQTAGWWRECIDLETLAGSERACPSDRWHKKRLVYDAYLNWQRKQRGYDDAVDGALFWKDMRELGAIQDERKAHNKVREVRLVPWDVADEKLRENLA
jgi:hypothetical protein